MIQKTKDERRKTKKGFTLIEALAFLFIFSVITLSFYQTWSLGTKHIINAKNRLGATAVANQQIEIIRGLAFDEVGTIAGIPPGIIIPNQTIAANTTTYTVKTVVQYVDDSTDGSAALGTDAAPNDYKKVTITVFWGGATDSEKVSAVSLFSLDGVESVAAGTGILSVNVLNDAGIGVSGATVHVTNISVSPSVDMTFDTDANGNGTFPGAVASVQGYHISVDKNGYYSNQTYDPYPTSTFYPANTHTSIVAGSLTTTTLVSDRKSTINFRTEDPYAVSVPNRNFTISGGLIIGTNADTSTKYDYAEDTTTDGDGERSLNNRSSGVYTVALGTGETGYSFLRLTPEEPSFGTIHLLPNTTPEITMILANRNVSSALIKVTNGASGPAIASASVQLKSIALGYDETVVTDTYGQAYFPVLNTPLAAGTYDVNITATGFETGTGTIALPGNALGEKSFALTAS